MPAGLHFSNSLEVLADRLIGNIGHPDPFESPIIAYPNAAVRDWLKMRIAEKTGIAVNIGFESLENLLWNRLAELDPFREAPDRKPAQRLENVDFQGLILNLLRHKPPAALKHYLEPGLEPEPQDDARRLCQLSGRLAALFREYEFSRVSEGGFRGLAETWNLGLECFGRILQLLPASDERRARLSEARELESWQREIYRGLFQPGDGMRDRWGRASGIYRYTLPQYAEMVWRQFQTWTPASSTGGVYHLFGLSQVSPFHRDLIRRLSDAETLGAASARFEIYALNPCAEYWEDSKLSGIQLQAEELPEPPENKDNVLLARFGKPGRETMALWNQIAGYDFSPNFLEPKEAGVLPALRRALLNRLGGLPTEERMDQDGSLQIRSAPDPFSEAESVKEQVLALFREDANLRPEEVGLALAHAESQLPVLRAVFAGLPLCVAEAGARESVLFGGFRALLDLALGPFRPASLLDYVENPCSTAADIDGARLREFLEDAGFQEGWDENHRAVWGAAPGSQSTLEAALRRALYGLILDPTHGGENLPPSTGAARRPDREILARWLERLEKLDRDLAPFRSGEKRTFSAWGKLLQTLLREYFLADPGPGEASSHASLAGFFRALENWGTWEQGGELIPHQVVLGLLEDHFRDPGGSRGSLLSEGLRAGSLQTLRGLPFRHLFILGLNAGDFPRARAASAYGGLDLRSFRRVLGESDPASHDLYAFLETIAVAGNVTLSYVRGEDAAEPGNSTGASYAVTGLISYLESDLLKAPFVIAHAGIPRSDLESVRLKTLAALPPQMAAAWARDKAAPAFMHQPPPEAEGDAVEEIELSALREFLRNPVQQAFRHFRLYGSLDDGEEEAPPLTFGAWESRDFLADAVRAELRAPGTGAGDLAADLRRRFLAGKTPPPPYADLERERLEKRVRDLAEPVQALRSALLKLGLRPAGTLRVGTSRKPLDPPLSSFSAFDGKACGLTARFRGVFPDFFAGTESQGWALLVNDGERAEAEAYVLHLCAVACGGDPLWKRPGHLIVRTFKSDAVGFKIHRLPALGIAETRRDFRALAEDFLRGPDLDHLPLKTIVDNGDPADPAQPDGDDWKTAIEEAEETAAEGFQLPSGPGGTARALKALDPKVPADAGPKIARRVAPFMKWRAAWEAIP